MKALFLSLLFGLLLVAVVFGALIEYKFLKGF
nr:MAG TPA: PsbA, PsbB, PsbC, PsbD, PsbE-FCP supercomplex, PLANT PROTEIN [Caudoviricetes sp.]